MCGRTCCTLSPDLIPLACSKVTKNNQVPKWIKNAPNAGANYEPGTNIPPTKYTPVLHIHKELQVESSPECVIRSMFWGVVPQWFQGSDPKQTKLSTNNARLEGLEESKIYKPLVEKNQRCVVVCDGFYEWKKTEKSEKQPYLIYSPQPSDCKVENLSKCSAEKNFEPDRENDIESGNWTGPNLTYMAGLYSVWYKDNDQEKQNPIYTYTIITRESNEVFSWLHHRVPAILIDRESVQKWLDPNLKGTKALRVLTPLKKGELVWHPVSRKVGNSKNQDNDLNQPIELDTHGRPVNHVQSGSANIMKNWLSNSSTKGTTTKESSDCEPTLKKKKT